MTDEKAIEVKELAVSREDCEVVAVVLRMVILKQMAGDSLGVQEGWKCLAECVSAIDKLYVSTGFGAGPEVVAAADATGQHLVAAMLRAGKQNTARVTSGQGRKSGNR